jgi:hypothetical protein
MPDYNEWRTSDGKFTYKSMNDKFSEDEESLEILNGTAVWVPLKKELSRIFYNPAFSNTVIL